MSPFDAFYGRKFNTPLHWDNTMERVIVGPNFLREMEEHILKIK